MSCLHRARALLLVTAWTAIAAIGAPALAGVSPSQDQDLKTLMDRDRSINGYGLGAGGHCEALWGNLADAAPGGPTETATTFLTAHGTLLGAPSGSDWQKGLVLLSTTTSEAGQTLVYAPAIDGVPYLRAAIRMQLTPAGRLAGVTAIYGAPSPVQRASIDAVRAIELARAQIPDALTGDGAVEEFLDADPAGNGVRGCFRVHLVAGTPPRQWTTLVGPAGEILEPPTDTCVGAVPDGLVVQGYPLPTPGLVDLRDLTRPTGSWAHWTLDGPHFKSESSFPIKATPLSGHFIYPPTSPLGMIPTLSFSYPPFLETNAYYRFNYGRDRALKWGAVEWDNYKMKYDVWLPPAWGNEYSFQNAYFLASDFSIHFAALDIIPPINPAQDISVILHEFGHSVEFAVHPGWNGGSSDEQHEAEAVAEGFADFFSASALDNPSIGDLFMTFGARSCENDFTYDKHVHDEIHDAGKIFSGACWDIHRKAGRDEAAKLAIAGARASNFPVTFHNIAQGILVADASLYGGSHLADLQDIFKRRGIEPQAPDPSRIAGTSSGTGH